MSMEGIDFTFREHPDKPVHIEVKEKKSRYDTREWPLDDMDEKDAFILDDLTVRKCLVRGPRCVILVWDHITKEYFVFPIVDLALMPRKRVNRQIHRNTLTLKGKWIIDFRNGQKCSNLDEVFKAIRAYVTALDGPIVTTTRCYGSFVGEEVPTAGSTRHPGHWQKDLSG